MHTSVSEALFKVAQATDLMLWNAFRAAERNEPLAAGVRLLFPHYEKGVRVSEQEARFTFARALEDSSFLYSVETPTVELYRQKGATDSRASFDLTVLDTSARALANCEFKCGGASLLRKNRMHIAKDLEKLLRDPGHGLWFHLLEAVDNSTLRNLLEVIRDEIDALVLKYPSIEPKTIVLHICVLRQEFSVHRELLIAPHDIASCRAQLDLSYEVTRAALVSWGETAGWCLSRRGLDAGDTTTQPRCL